MNITKIDSTAPLTMLIVNDGAEIKMTSYFETPYAKQGALFLSWNAHYARLLVPASMHEVIRETKNAFKAELECDNDFIFIYFNDGQAEEYRIMIHQEMMDRIFEKNHGSKQETEILIYTKAGLQKRIPLTVLNV